LGGGNSRSAGERQCGKNQQILSEHGVSPWAK
jgi:hypothetical protein